MATNINSVTNHFPKPQNGFTTTLSASISSGASIVPLSSVSGYTNGDIAVFVVDPSDVNKKQTFTGIIDTANTRVTSVVWTAGTNVDHIAGATVVDYATATHLGMVSKGILVSHNQNGTLKTGIIDSDKIAANAVVTAGINNGAVTSDKLATNAVQTAKIADNAITPAKLAGPITLTNGATITPDATARVNIINALNINAYINTATNASYDGQALLFRIKDNGVARTITWSPGYRAVGVTIPTTTVASKMLYVGVIYNSVDAAFDVISVARQA